MCSLTSWRHSFSQFFFLLFDRAVVSQLWQIAVPTVRSQRVLYQSLGSEELSLPWGFLSEMFHNCSRSEHVQTQAAVRFVENWLDYSQPATTSMPAASFSVFGGRRATSCYSPPVFSFCFDTRWDHMDDWHDVSLQAWPLLKTSLTTIRIVQQELCCFFLIVAFMIFQHRVIKKLFVFAHLAVQEAETNFGAVNHPSVVLHIDAALLPATGRVVGRIPLYVLYRLQIFMGHFLQPVKTLVMFRHDTNKPVRLAPTICQSRL